MARSHLVPTATRTRRPAAFVFAALILACATAAATVLPPITAPGLAAARPAPCVPFGTAQLPPGAPSTGDLRGMSTLRPHRGDAPSTVALRTERTQFNRHREFALVGHRLLVRPRGTTGRGWREVRLPHCLAGRLVAISLDDDELVGVDRAGWIYTMDNVNQSPLLWNWTSAWGAMLWTGGGRRLPDARTGGWALSVTSPSDNRSYRDIAGRVHPSGQAKMTMIPALTGDGSRIVYADPWLPDDDSYEIGSPLGGRFRSVALSASASTTFVMNRYGDMFTRTFDFDSSGSDSVFFRYSWESQHGKPSARDLTTETWDRSTAAVQLPAPDWTPQPKIPGEITSAITVVATAPGPERRELRVEGRRAGSTGYWHKALAAPSWRFTRTGAPLIREPIENSPTDRSAQTLAPPTRLRYTAPLPSRRAAVDGQTLIDIGLPYSVVDPRLLDRAGLRAGPSGYRLLVDAFDPAVTTRSATVRTPSGARIPVLLHTADGMRMSPRAPGITADPRHLIGAVALDRETYARRGTDPVVGRFVREWMRGETIAPITLSVTEHDMVIR